MKNIVIGRFIPGTSFLYKMDPRTKIIVLILLMVSAFLVRSLSLIAIGLLLLMVVLLAGRISVKRVLLGLRPLMFLLLFTFSFQIFFNTAGNLLFSTTLAYSPGGLGIVGLLFAFWWLTKRRVPFKLLYFLLLLGAAATVLSLFSYGPVIAESTIEVYSQGLEMALFIMLRLVIIVTLSTILTLTTKPTDLNLGLEAVLKPFKLIRVNTEEMAMIISISLRYIPTLLDEANKIILAQASRGVDFSEGKLKDKLMQIVSLLVPMFIISFKRSDELASAMEARSFVPGRPRTRLHLLTWRPIDTVALCLAIVVLTAVVMVRVMGW
ncbi:MAG: energy-coupling factor transporter transmembrane protein EcfT [Acholeplasmatales bacterium]|nr:MAG: energy-coupling factor transporter transmembrane protein EcfT [Acholeplasmatales bacterium]